LHSSDSPGKLPATLDSTDYNVCKVANQEELLLHAVFGDFGAVYEVAAVDSVETVKAEKMSAG